MVCFDDLVLIYLTKLKVFVDGHNVGVKSNDVDKSEGGQVLLKLCGLRKWMVMFNLLVFICYIMFCVCESL